MQKFTIFSVLLTIIIIVAVAQIIVNDYFPDYADDGNTNVLEYAFSNVFTGSDADVNSGEDDRILRSGLTHKISPEGVEYGADEFDSVLDSYGNDVFQGSQSVLNTDNVGRGSYFLDDVSFGDASFDDAGLDDAGFDDTGLDDAGFGDTFFGNTVFGGTDIFGSSNNTTGLSPLDSSVSYEPVSGVYEKTTGLSDFEDKSYADFSLNVYIREDQIKSAGFTTAYLENEAHDGYLYKTVYIDDILDLSFKKYVVRDQSRLFSKVYVVSPAVPGSLESVYSTIMSRASKTLNTTLNSTNEYGSGSFYMNDEGRSGTAFLTVKIGSSIYGFSYPKEYHPQIKNLIKLLIFERQ